MVHPNSWQTLLREAIAAYIDHTAAGMLDPSHLNGTPHRVVRAFEEYVAGYNDDPAKYLVTKFNTGKARYDGMVHVEQFDIITRCAHHLEPIIGKAHFAYVPKDRKVVGLSKIPRFTRALCQRLQVQEDLTEEIVDTFMQHVQPYGCGVSIHAVHFCMVARGVREHDAVTRTTALRGSFKTNKPTRDEFQASLNREVKILG